MCLIAFAIGASPSCPLLLASNRDEYLDRPTAALHRWVLADGTPVLAGRDLRDGGTWLGMSASGRVAMLTNVRSAEARTGRRSRGELPSLWLQDSTDPDALPGLIDPSAYGGFNLVVGDVVSSQWRWLSNRDPADPHQDQAAPLHVQSLAPGVYGLSNAALDTAWSKTVRLKQVLQAALGGTKEATEALLTGALSDTEVVASDLLPRTGVPQEVERALSSPFVDLGARGYGTRSSLLLQVSASSEGWRADLREWTHSPDAAGRPRWSTEPPRRLQLP